jgi:hypothetical protein
LDKKAMTEPADTTPEIPGQQELPDPPESFTPEPVEEPVREAPTEPDPTSTVTTDTAVSPEATADTSDDAADGPEPDTTVQHRFRVIHEQWLPGANNPTHTYTTESRDIDSALEFLHDMAGRHDL